MEFKLKKNSAPSLKTTTINFVSNKKQEGNKKTIAGFLVFVLLMIPFIKFGVLDQLSKLNEAENNYRFYEDEKTALLAKLANYTDVKKEYDSMVGTYLSETEKANEDRLEIIDMVEEDIMEYVDITSLSIVNNSVTVQTGLTSMSTVSNIVKILNDDERNSFVGVTTAKSSDPNEERVSAQIKITYRGVLKDE